jgi:hypothetical protein
MKYEQERHMHVLKEIIVETKVIPDDPDSYIQMREKGFIPGFTNGYILSVAYLKRKGISFSVEKF